MPTKFSEKPKNPIFQGDAPGANGARIVFCMADRLKGDYPLRNLAPKYVSSTIGAFQGGAYEPYWTMDSHGIGHAVEHSNANYAGKIYVGSTAEVFQDSADSQATIVCQFRSTYTGSSTNLYGAWGAYTPNFADRIKSVWFKVPSRNTNDQVSFRWQWTTLTALGLSDLQDDSIWVCTTGPRGMEIWRDGNRLASNGTTATLTTDARIYFYLFDGHTGFKPVPVPPNSDYLSTPGVMGYFALYNFQMNENQIANLYNDPWQLVKPRKKWYQIGMSLGQALVEIIDETERVVEAVAYSRGLRRLVNEVEQIPETTSVARALNRIVSEVETTVETLSRARALTRVVSATQQVVEAVVRARTMRRVVDETEQVPETTVSTRALTRTLSEVQRVVEGVLHARSITRVVIEVESLIETGTIARAMNRVVDEMERALETTVASRALTAVANDVQQIAEAVIRARQLVRLTDETERVSETLVTSKGLIKVLDEVERLVETVDRARGMVRTADEVEQLVEAVLHSRLITQVVAEVQRIVEDASKASGLARAVDEQQAIQEAVVRAVAIARTIDETQTLIETIVGARGLTRVIDDQEAIQEAITRALGEGIMEYFDVILATGLLDVVLAASSCLTTLADASEDVALVPDAPEATSVILADVSEDVALVPDAIDASLMESSLDVALAAVAIDVTVLPIPEDVTLAASAIDVALADDQLIVTYQDGD